MSHHLKPTPVAVGDDTAELTRLLDVLAENTIDRALADLERTLDRLRAGEERAAAAREVLRISPAETLREALRLPAGRNGSR